MSCLITFKHDHLVEHFVAGYNSPERIKIIRYQLQNCRCFFVLACIFGNKL